MAGLKDCNRRWVALTIDDHDPVTHRPRMRVVTSVSEPGAKREAVHERARAIIAEVLQLSNSSDTSMLDNLFVVSWTVAKRSYKRAMREHRLL